MNFTRTPSDKCNNAAFIDETAHLFQTTPGDVFAEPQEAAVDVDHLSWDAERVAGVAAVKYGTKRASENIESYFLVFFLGFNSSLRCL